MRFYGRIILFVLVFTLTNVESRLKSENGQGQKFTQTIPREKVQAFLQQLWSMEKESNKFLRVEVNAQGRTVRWLWDEAPKPLFGNLSLEWVSTSSPTTEAFFKLLDNYYAEHGNMEKETEEEVGEMNDFLKKLLQTRIMQETLKFLQSNGINVGSESDFKELLKSIWFQPYTRRKYNDSSGFEHVFVGETSYKRVVGLNNWIQLSRLEILGQINYLGYSRMCGTPTRLITVAYRKKPDKIKRRSTILVGTSPEFEMAIYTTVFLSQQTTVPMVFEECHTQIRCTPQGWDKSMIGTCYPTRAM